METFRVELTQLLNRHNRENASGTPDFILADYLIKALEAYDDAIISRTAWARPRPPPKKKG